MLNTKSILNQLSNNIGTEHYYKIMFSSIVYTDGIKELIGLCNCYWLISDTAIEITHNKALQKQFLILNIKVNKDKSAIVTLKEDSNKPLLYAKRYSYTDFPLSEYEFYIIDDVMLLKSEY